VSKTDQNCSGYGPDFNPIEQVFSKIKNELRLRELRTIDSLENAFGESLEWITKTDAMHYFQNSVSSGASKRFFRRSDDELALGSTGNFARAGGRRHVSTDFLSFTDSGFVIMDSAFAELTLAVAAASTATEAACPMCGSLSQRVHSRYRRTIADLPFGGRICVLRLVVRRFRCTNAGCERRIFCKRFPEWLASHARSTDRPEILHREIGSVAGGEAGSSAGSIRSANCRSAAWSGVRARNPKLTSGRAYRSGSRTARGDVRIASC